MWPVQYLGIAAALSVYALAGKREQFTFNSGDTKLVGYRYSPSSQAGDVPVIVIAHGLGGLQSSRLQPIAEAFTDAGYQALTFDYRYWGESEGAPRNIVDIPKQQEDYRAAVATAKTFSGVDPKRIVIWGTSLSGGHVLELGATLPAGEITAVIAQAPFVNGASTGDEDSVPGLASPVYIPIANHTGQLGALTQPGAWEGYQFVQPNPPAPGNVLAARFVLALPLWSPDAVAANTTLPTFIGVAEDDNITPPEPSLELAKTMKTVTLQKYPGGHFDVYPGAESYDMNIKAQLEFLKKNVPI